MSHSLHLSHQQEKAPSRWLCLAFWLKPFNLGRAASWVLGVAHLARLCSQISHLSLPFVSLKWQSQACLGTVWKRNPKKTEAFQVMHLHRHQYWTYSRCNRHHSNTEPNVERWFPNSHSKFVGVVERRQRNPRESVANLKQSGHSSGHPMRASMS